MLLLVHVLVLTPLACREAHFLGALKVTEAPNAENLARIVIEGLQTLGKLTPEQIGNKLMGVAADGARVMTGVITGVLQVNFSTAIALHAQEKISRFAHASVFVLNNKP